MAITRINTDQITDSAVTTAKIAAKNITSAKLEDNLSYGSNLTITGNLTVQGTTTSVDSTNLTVEDPILVLSSGASTGTNDAGILIERGSDDSYALLWDESADKFVFGNVGSEDGTTAGNITIASNADVVMGNLEAAGITMSGNLTANAITANTSTTTNTLTVNTTSTFGGDIDLNANIDVSGNAVAAALTVNGAGTIGGTLTGNSLTVNTTSTFGGDLDVNANIDASGSTTTGTLAVNTTSSFGGDIDLNANIDTSGSTTTGTLAVNTTSTFGGDIDLNANIDTSGSTTTGTLAVNTTSSFGGDIDLNANIDASGSVTAASVTANGATSTNTLSVTTTSSFGGDLDVNANIDTSGSTTTGTLAVNTTSSFGGDIDLNANIDASGSVTAASVTANGATSTNTLSVTTTSSYGGDLDVNANIDVSGSVTADTVSVNTSATLASAAVSDLTDNRIVVAGTSGELEDSADLTFDGTALAVGGTAGLTVAGTANVEGAFTANGAANLNGAVTVGPNVTIDAGANQITNVADPTVAQAAATKAYVDNAVNSDVKEKIQEGNSTVEVHDDGVATTYVEVTIDGTQLANLTASGMTIDGTMTAGNITIDTDTISSVHSTLTLDPATAGVGGTVVIAGNLQVTGTTTTVNSTVVTIADPVYQIGEDTADNLDRGIKTLYNDGASKVAFFGLDDSADEFVFIHDATDSSSVFSGSLGNAAFGSLRVTDLTNNRVLIGGTSGEIEDDANLTFDGSTLNVGGAITATGAITGDTLTANTSATLASAAISDLTSGRVVLAGTSGELQDSANLTFSGGALTVTGTATISTSVTTGTLTVNTTSTFGGDIDLNANLDASGSVTADTLVANTSATLASAAISDLTSGRVVLAGTSGELEDNAGLTYNGSDLSVTGNVAATAEVGAATLNITSTSTFGGDLDVNANIDVSAATTTNTLAVNTTSTFGGDLDVNANIDVSAATTTNTLAVNTTSTFGGDIDLNANIDASGSVTAASITSNSSVSTATMTSSGLTTANSLTVNTTSTFGGDLDVNANIDVSAATTTNTLAVNTTSTFGGDLDVNANIDVSAATTTNTLAVNTTSTFGGDIDLNANIDASGSVTADTLVANTSATLASAAVSDLTSGRVVLAGTSGELEDSGNLTFDGSDLTVTGNAAISAGLSAEDAIIGDVIANLTTGVSFEVASTDSMMLPKGTTAQRPATPVAGMFRFNTTNNQQEIYNGTEWSAGTEFTLIESETFTGDGSTVAYTLQKSMTTASVIVSINGVVQIPTTAYGVSGTTLTFTEAPASGDTVEVRELITTTTVVGLDNNDGESVAANASAQTVDITAGGTGILTISSTSILADAGYTPTVNGDLVTKSYVDGELSSLSSNSISAGTSDVTVAENSSVTINVAGSAGLTVSSAGVTVAGNLTVSGTTTTVNSTTLDVADLNITVAKGAGTSAAANGAGLTVDAANATLTYASTGDKWVFNKDLDMSTNDILNAGTINGTATSAQYADLAEMYAADAEYAPGTVVAFGGDAEVTEATDGTAKVAGVVSTNPAHLMNSALEADHAVAVALTGRVPVKVTGTIAKGDMLVAAGNGMARAEAEPKMGTVIGKALEDFDGAEGVIEVVVGRL